MKRRVTFECDSVKFFDTVKKIGVEAATEALGQRFVAAMLTDVSFFDHVGFGVYDIIVTEEKL